MPRIVPVILSGGSGTRLWPLSRELSPKQLLPLVTERTLLQETVLRVQALRDRVEPPIVVCNEAHGLLVAKQLREIDVAPQSIVLEPAGRNTAPAVAVAALLAVAGTATSPAAGADSSPDPVLVVLPADHVILDTAAFVAAVGAATGAAAEGRLVTFGIVPDRAETGYGYLRKGASRGAWSELERFIEKPDAATAERYVATGEYFWNSGMFVFNARTYLEELGRVAPAMLAKCRAAIASAATEGDCMRLGQDFIECPADSIDYAVMEKTRKAAVVPLAAGWSDVGSWAVLHDVLDKDEHGNVLKGQAIADECRDSYVAATSRLVAVIGLEGVVVVETEDAVLVMSKDRAQRIKSIVEKLPPKFRR
jgi:mannose-1-phosphate guanylyltransferase/mannose-6-phosphate isomerase